MQALVSKTFETNDDMSMHSKRFKAGVCASASELIAIPKRTPMNRLKLQFPSLDEEVGYYHPICIPN
jgi:hypothetical protein